MPDIDKLIQERGYNYTSNVFDVLIQDPTNDMLIAHADSLSESGLDIATEMTEKRGGPQNAILFYIPANKTVSVNMTNIAFDETWLALQTGEKFSIGEFEIFGNTASLEVTTDGTKRTVTLTDTPVGSYVYVNDGFENLAVKIDSANPEIIDVTGITGKNDGCIDVTYAALSKVKHMSIKGNTAPAVVKLTLKKTVVNGSTSKPVKELIVVIPRFQLDGNLSLSGTLGDTDTMGLSGNAIAARSTQCGDTEQILADVFIKELDSASLMPTRIEVPEEYEVSEGSVENITVIGKLGASLVYSDYDATAECTYESEDELVATVDAAGKITGVSSGLTTINITHTSGRKTSTMVNVV